MTLRKVGFFYKSLETRGLRRLWLTHVERLLRTMDPRRGRAGGGALRHAHGGGTLAAVGS
jgi:hypothetical protein